MNANRGMGHERAMIGCDATRGLTEATLPDCCGNLGIPSNPARAPSRYQSIQFSPGSPHTQSHHQDVPSRCSAQFCASSSGSACGGACCERASSLFCTVSIHSFARSAGSNDHRRHRLICFSSTRSRRVNLIVAPNIHPGWQTAVVNSVTLRIGGWRAGSGLFGTWSEDARWQGWFRIHAPSSGWQDEFSENEQQRLVP